MKSNWSRRELYALGETLGDCVTERKLGGGYICGGGGKGGGGGPQQTTAYQTNLPEYAKPYVTTMLEATQKQLFNTQPGADGTTEITGFKPYTPYSSDPTQYFAGPSSLQTMGYNEAAGMTTPTQFAPATGIAGLAGQQALGAQGQAQNLMGTALGYGQAGAGYGQAGQLYGAQGAAQAQRAAQQAQRAAGLYGQQGAMYGAQAAGLAPAAQAYGQGAANIGMQGLGYGAQGAGYGQQAANMAGMGFGAGQQYAQGVTDPNAIAAYMSPYQQAVTDVAKNAAVREAQIAQQQANLGAARQGTYGGARQALQQSERERNLLANLSNIQAQGSQAAYDKAIAAQQFGANLGLQGLQAGYQGLSQGMQGAQTGLSGLGTAMQGQQAGLAGLQQAGSLYGQGMQGAQTGLSGVGQQLAAGNLGLQGTAQGIQGAQAGMQGAGVGLSGVQGALGAGQYGLQGTQAATQAAQTLGQLGTAEQQADISRIGLQQQLGSAQQQYQQNIINQAIQDYATAQQYPMMQLGFMSNMLRGLPLQATTTQSYMPTPNLTTQAIAGLGTAAGAYKAFGMKAGGKVPSYAGPEGSEVEMGMKAKLEALASTDAGLAQVARIAETSPSVEMRKLANQVLIEKRTEDQAAAQAEQSIAQDQAPKGLAAAPAPVMDTLGAAGGGIVAFAGEDGSDVEYDPTKVYGDPYKMMSDVQLIERDKKRRELLGIGDVVTPEYREYLTKQKEGSKAYEDRLAGIELMKWASKINRPGRTLDALIAGTGESGESIAGMYDKVRGREAEIAKGMQDIYGKERTDKLGILTGIEKDQDEIRKALGERERARLSHSQRTTDLMQVYGIELAALGAQGKDMKDPRVQKIAMDNAQRIFGGRGAAQEAKDRTTYTNAVKVDPQIGEKGLLRKELRELKLKTPPKDPEKLAKHNASIDDLEQRISQREAYLERKHLGGGQQSGVINLDNQQ